jgi:hypothetical protein
VEPPDFAEPPIFFIHVMKTGGTTVMRNLRETYALDEIYPYKPLDLEYLDGGELDLRHHLSVPYILSLSPERRGSIKVFVGHLPFVLRDLLGMELRTTTLLRHPVERTISLLRQFRRKQPWEEDPVDRRPLAARSMEEAYEHPLAFEPLILNHQTKIFSLTAADDPQTYMDVIPLDEARLALAKRNLEEVDVIGVQERFDHYLDLVEERFGWQIVRGARKNATPDDDVEPVPASLRRRIEEDNALDVELYEHARRLVEERAASSAGRA